MRLAKNVCRLVAAVALGIVLGGCQAFGPAPWDIPPGVQTRAVNGYPLAYLERGAGPALILVHGGLNDYRYWTPQMESLSSRFRAISISLRHYYPEPWNGEGSFSVKQHSEDLATFIEGLGLGPVILVTHSRGGSVGVDLAHSRPDLVKKLVLLDPALYSLIPPSEAGSSEEVRIWRAKTAETYFRRGELEAGVQYFFDDINGSGAWNRLSEEQRQIRLQNAWTIVGSMNDSAERVGCEDIGRLKMPVLLIDGERSPEWLKNIRKTFQKCLPSAGWITIPKATHQMNHTNPGAFNEALITFLSN